MYASICFVDNISYLSLAQHVWLTVFSASIAPSVTKVFQRHQHALRTLDTPTLPQARYVSTPAEINHNQALRIHIALETITLIDT